MKKATIIVNGRPVTIRAGMRAAEVKALLGIAPSRVLIARGPDGRLGLVADHQGIPSAQVLDVPHMIYG